MYANGSGPLAVRPSATAFDTDNDGLSDFEERFGCLDANDDLVCDDGSGFGPATLDNLIKNTF